MRRHATGHGRHLRPWRLLWMRRHLWRSLRKRRSVSRCAIGYLRARVLVHVSLRSRSRHHGLARVRRRWLLPRNRNLTLSVRPSLIRLSHGILLRLARGWGSRIGVHVGRVGSHGSLGIIPRVGGSWRVGESYALRNGRIPLPHTLGCHALVILWNVLLHRPTNTVVVHTLSLVPRHACL